MMIQNDPLFWIHTFLSRLWICIDSDFAPLYWFMSESFQDYSWIQDFELAQNAELGIL